jgi:UDP-N-acetylmuramyl pentapeptide synthase
MRDQIPVRAQQNQSGFQRPEYVDISLTASSPTPRRSSMQATIDIREIGPEKFELFVTFEGQRFACGNYLNRAAAQQAGRLFVARKEGEQVGRRKTPRRK